MVDLSCDTTIKERFESKIRKEPCLNIESLEHYSNLNLDLECWIWTAYTDRDGYGTIGVGPVGQKIVKLSHRVSYELYNGKIPVDMCVCHYCDNPSCVNPNHLFLGEITDNVSDRVSKKRSAFGNSNGMYTKPHTRIFGNEYNSKNWIIIDENDNVVEVSNLAKFCRRVNIGYDKLLSASKGNKFYRGFKCRKKGAKI